MEKIKNFLKRIGLDGLAVAHTVDFLGKVQEACVLTIPYENLDILRGKPISLEGEDIYKKIVTEHRGGYCFELNALLHAMLSEMGFEVKSCFARFLRGESTIPFRRHRIVVVTLDGADYLLDIGVGQIAPRFPLKLEEGVVQEQNGETYRFERDADLGWILTDFYKGEWRRYISFTTETQYEVDFTPASFWCEKHPDSPFNKGNMLAIKTPCGRKTLDGNTYKEFEGVDLVRAEELDGDGVERVLADVFGIRGV